MTVARRVPVAAAVLLLLFTWQVRAQKPRKIIDGESVSALRTWVDAVGAHTPGRADAAVVTVAGFPYETREVLNTGMTLFLTALMGWSYDAANNKAAETIAAMGHAAGKDFLKRAAVLHSDVAAYGYLHPLPSAGVPKPAANRQRELQLGTGATETAGQ